MRYPGAVWIPSPNCNAAAFVAPILGVVQHTMVGTLASADGYFGQPASQVSAHFGVGFDGIIHQYVDTDDVAWHAGYDANHHYHGIEFEDGGNPDTPMTPAQIGVGGQLIAWLAARYGWPIRNAAAFGQQGVIGHIEVWPTGGHSCPNPTRLRQKAALIICALANQPAPPAPGPTVAVPIDSPEEPMQRLIVQVPTDATGCGSVILDGGASSQPGVTSRTPAVDSAKVFAVGGWGSDPPVDGYQARHVALWQDRGGHPLITVAGAVPGHQAAVWVSVAD